MSHLQSPVNPIRRMVTLLTVLFTLCLAAAPAAMAQQDQWIHVKVESASGEGETVTVNLPLSLLSAAAAMIPPEVLDEAHNEMEVGLDEMHMSWQQLRDLWQQVRDSPDATYVTVETENENVKVWKEGDFLRVATTEGRDTEIDVQFPLTVVDALFSGPDNQLDLPAALQALADYGPGNLVSIRDGDQTVRVWIDDQNETE